MSFNWKDLVATVAPTVATAFGSPMAGIGVKMLLKAVGIEPEEGNEEQQLEQVMKSATPDDLLKMKQADQSFKVEMKKLGINLAKIHSADRGSARAREIALRDNAPKILAAVVVVGFFGTLYCVGFVELQDGAAGAVNILLGALTGLLMQVGNYYFGSSAGSKQKTDALHDAIKK